MSCNERLAVATLAAVAWFLTTGAQPLPKNGGPQSATQTLDKGASDVSRSLPAIETDLERIARALEAESAKAQPEPFSVPPGIATDLDRIADALKDANERSFDHTISGISLFLSGLGLIAVLGTLVATIRAANAAVEAAKQAKQATEVTQEIGQAQVRAYVEILEVRARFVEWVPLGQPHDDFVYVPEITIAVKNRGNSPALEYRYAATMNFADENNATYGEVRGTSNLHSVEIQPTVIPSGPKRKLSYIVRDAAIVTHVMGNGMDTVNLLFWERHLPEQGGNDEKVEGTLRIVATIHTNYRDVFEREVSDNSLYVGDFAKGVDRAKTEIILRRDPNWPF